MVVNDFVCTNKVARYYECVNRHKSVVLNILLLPIKGVFLVQKIVCLFDFFFII
jgi:hypothetical protein